ncbi:uncharacterized protein B0H64DRAFT_2209 [Chaetomium fimeti]|uniref:Rhodopsin domain-containing protein n=1 Tax=Chaetomium fimeti TaxID=1854472 RepID=A0AAE0HNJ7_9PEZI|nr:hypothetical protein B0H64DRAFT_2209 [Chaetomium fimeti]
MNNTTDADNPESLAGSIVLTCILAPLFAVLFVALRFFTARRILRTIHVDDWLILAALVFSISYSICIAILTNHGLGYHRAYLAAQGLTNLRTFMMLSILSIAITGNISILFIKTSILRFYLRFSTSRRFNIAVYILMFLVIAAYLTGAFGFLFGCQPINYQWDYATMEGKGRCLAMDPWYGWLVAFNCITDAVLLVLPAWIIGPLRIGFAQKAALAAILGTGGFVFGVSVMRFVIVAQGWGDTDFTFKFAVNYIWSIIETNVGIVCACAPCLRALVGRYIPSLMHLGRRDEAVDLYTIPVSQVAQRLPSSPARGRDKETGTDSTNSTTSMPASPSWRNTFFGQGAGSSSRREQV